MLMEIMVRKEQWLLPPREFVTVKGRSMKMLLIVPQSLRLCMLTEPCQSLRDAEGAIKDTYPVPQGEHHAAQNTDQRIEEVKHFLRCPPKSYCPSLDAKELQTDRFSQKIKLNEFCNHWSWQPRY